MDVFDILFNHPETYVCGEGCLLDVLHASSGRWVAFDSEVKGKVYCRNHGRQMFKYPDMKSGKEAAYTIRSKGSNDHGWSEEEPGVSDWWHPGVGY